MLRHEGWKGNHKRVERIWRREGLKVPQKQPKRGCLWLKRLRQFCTDGIITATPKKAWKALFYSSLYRNAVYIMLNFGVLAIAGFVFWVLVARLYSTDDVGLAAAAISAAALLALVSTLGMDNSLIRFLSSSDKKSNVLLNSCFTIGGLVSIVIALIFLAGLGFWSPTLVFLRQNPFFICGFVAFVAALTLSALLNSAFIAERRAGFTLTVQGIIWSLCRITLVVLLATFSGAFSILASWGFGAILSLIIGIFLFLPRVQAGYRPRFRIKREEVKKILNFSSANYVVSLFLVVPTLILPLLVVNMLGAEANAYFYIAWSMSFLLFGISFGTSKSLFAEGSHDEIKLSKDIKRSIALTFGLVVPAVILIFLIGDKLLLIFGTAYSENATTLLWILALSALPFSLNNIYFAVKRVEMKMKKLVGLSAFMAVIALVLSYVLLPQMGILGAGVAWLTSQVLVAMLIMKDFLQKATWRENKTRVN